MSTEQIEAFRAFVYPFGFLSSIAFGLRFLVQWGASEVKQRSVVPKLFWHLSLSGNFLLMLHSLVQLHFPMYILQSQHIVLSWRNLNLMGKSPIRLRSVITLLVFVASAATFVFIAHQRVLGAENTVWIRSLNTAKRAFPTWLHTVGCIGVGLFSLRFWIQWWEAERSKKTVLSNHFWWISLFGSVVAAFYFYRTSDLVNITGPAFSLIPYIRNLMLLKKEKAPPCDIAIIAGETSGDLLGKQIAQELLQSQPELALCGVAGPAMRKARVTPWMRTESFQVMGIVDVIKKLPFLTFSIYRLVRTIMRNNPKAVICIDQPSFSLAIAKRLKKKGFSGKIIQVVAPTVWAYRPERVEIFSTYFDLILPLFRFEKELFSKKLPTVWIGHPTLRALKQHEVAKEKTTLALFPGSRPGEIRRNLPLQLNAVAAILQNHPDLQIAISISKTLSLATQNFISTLARKKLPKNIELVDFDDRYELMSRSKAAIAKLGTVTLELALFDVPCVCCYKVGRFTEWWARRFLKLKPRNFALPNILYGKKVIPECVIPPVQAQDLRKEIEPYLIGEKSLPKDFRHLLMEQIDPCETSDTLIANSVLECLS